MLWLRISLLFTAAGLGVGVWLAPPLWGWALLLALLTLVVWFWPQPRLAAPLAHPLLLPGEKAKAPAQGAALGLLLLALLLSLWPLLGLLLGDQVQPPLRYLPTPPLHRDLWPDGGLWARSSLWSLLLLAVALGLLRLRPRLSRWGGLLLAVAVNLMAALLLHQPDYFALTLWLLLLWCAGRHGPRALRWIFRTSVFYWSLSLLWIMTQSYHRRRFVEPYIGSDPDMAGRPEAPANIWGQLLDNRWWGGSTPEPLPAALSAGQWDLLALAQGAGLMPMVLLLLLLPAFLLVLRFVVDDLPQPLRSPLNLLWWLLLFSQTYAVMNNLAGVPATTHFASLLTPGPLWLVVIAIIAAGRRNVGERASGLRVFESSNLRIVESSNLRSMIVDR